MSEASEESIISTELSPEDERLAKLLVTFSMPHDLSGEESELAKEIVRIDHRSLHTLPPKSKERSEIRDLLINVVRLFQSRQTKAARSLLHHVEGVYFQHIQARNRLRYLIGMLVGIAAIMSLGFLLVRVSTALEGVISAEVLLMVFLFAGMGALTSVLIRLSSIDLRDQTSIWMVVVSGIARPVTAVFLALVVCLMFGLRIIEFHIGVPASDGSSGSVPPSLLFVVAFLCGFSERFAKDVLARVGGQIDGPDQSGRARKPDHHELKPPE